MTPRVPRGARIRARLARADGQSTTEWLMIAGVLTAVAVFLVGTFPDALGTFMKSMALSLRTIAP